MANAVYDTARDSFLNGGLNWGTDSVKAVLVNIAGGHYTVNLATDQFLTSIAAGDRVATVALTLKTSAAGVANAAGITFALVTGAQCGAIVLYKDTGAAATSPLIAYIDTMTGLPVTPSGGDILIVWDIGANKVFKL